MFESLVVSPLNSIHVLSLGKCVLSPLALISLPFISRFPYACFRNLTSNMETWREKFLFLYFAVLSKSDIG